MGLGRGQRLCWRPGACGAGAGGIVALPWPWLNPLGCAAVLAPLAVPRAGAGSIALALHRAKQVRGRRTPGSERRGRQCAG